MQQLSTFFAEMFFRIRKVFCLLGKPKRFTTSQSRTIFLKRSWLDHKTPPDSFATRLNEYLSKQTLQPTFPSLTITQSEQQPNISKLSFDQLCSLIKHNALKTNDPSTFVTNLDTECLLRIPRLSHRQLLALIHAFHQLLPRNFVQLDCYLPAMIRMCETYESDQTTEDFVRICYYLGAAKKNHTCPQLLDKFVKRHFNKYVNRVSCMDLAIVAAATYRTAVPLQARHAKRFEQEILEMDVSTSIDFPLLNVFIKTLRLSRFAAEQVQQRLMEWMRRGRLDDIEFRGLAHLFVYFADNRRRDPLAMEWFCRQTMRKIRTAPSCSIESSKRFKSDWRSKDFRLILWCLAHLNLRRFMSDGDVKLLGDIVMDRFRGGEFENEDDLVDLTMSLWQLDFGNQDLFRALFKDYSPEPAPAHLNRIKLDGRRNLLLFCIELEHPQWLDELRISRTREHVFRMNREVSKKMSKNSFELNRVNDGIRRLMGRESVRLVCPIRNLNIPGILVALPGGENMHFIEVLERHTILSDGQTPFGVLQLKMDILRRLGYNVNLVSHPIHFNNHN